MGGITSGSSGGGAAAAAAKKKKKKSAARKGWRWVVKPAYVIEAERVSPQLCLVGVWTVQRLLCGVGGAKRKSPLQEKSPIGRMASLLCLCLQHHVAGLVGVWIIMSSSCSLIFNSIGAVLSEWWALG
jgi:hypothetical protein